MHDKCAALQGNTQSTKLPIHLNREITREHGFRPKNAANSTRYFFELCGSPWQITANSIANRQLKENLLYCSKYPTYIFIYEC